MYRVIVAGLLTTLMISIAVAQDQKSAPPPGQTTKAQDNTQNAQSKSGQAASSQTSQAPAPHKTVPLALTRAQRLGAAKSVFIKKVEGSSIPVNVITDSLQGWGRYTVVSAPDKADLLIEITSPEEQPSSVTINGSHTNPLTGYPETSTSTSRNLSSVPIKMTVFDAKTKLPLWSATEQPKHALKQKAREDNLVDAAQTLFSKFHDAVEPSLQ
jgi:hypothetical protein